MILEWRADGQCRRLVIAPNVWNTSPMHTRRSGLALVLVLVLVGAGCGLFESNDDELETLRAELVQLREDVLDLETEVALLAVSPPTIAASVPTVTTTTRPEVS